ncbi:MAG: hypothetical protein IJ011_06770 [Clostridia bacterium]|nr:hypothetical protein [Clostridia bacterium]
MITFGKIARIVSVMTLAVLLFTSCASNNVEQEYPFISLGTEENEVITEYRIVIPSSASAKLSDAARLLCEAIETETGVTSELYYDSENVENTEGAWTVYVGEVNSTDASKHIRFMRSKDYTCRSYGNFTVICGANDSATLTAIERFKTEILPVSDEKRLIPDGGGFDYEGSYPAESLSIGEADISDYAIFAYRNDDADALSCAYELRDNISEAFGYWLDVHIGSPSDEQRYIYIEINGKDCMSGRAELEFTGKSVILKAPDAYGIKTVTERFFELLCADGKEGTLSPKLPSSLFIPYHSTETQIGSFSLFDILPFDALSEITALCGAIGEYSPDMFMCGALEDTDAQNLREAVSSYSALTDNGGAAFSKPDVILERRSSKNIGGLLAESFYVKDGELEFIFVYICGSETADTQIDISELVGDTPYPVVAAVHTYNCGSVSLTRGGSPYFCKAIEKENLLYGNRYSYSCYADLDRLSVIESGQRDSCGYRQITVAVP